MSDTATFEREAADTRDRISSTFDELQARLAPKALIDNAVDQISASGAKAIASVRGVAMGHPIAIIATGLTIGVALFARRKVRAATIEYGDSYAAYADYDDGYAANLAADDVPTNPVAAQFDALQHKAQDAVEDHPLALVLSGLVAGAVIGSVVPVSAAESNIMRDIGSRLEAAGEAALDATKGELDFTKFSFVGGTTGIADRAIQSLVTILAAAGSALFKKSSAA